VRDETRCKTKGGGGEALLFPYFQNFLVCACVPGYHSVSGYHWHHCVVGQTTNTGDLVL